MFKLNFFAIILFVLIFRTNGQIQVDYSCSLKWVSEGYGNVPVTAIVPAPGEFIARVNLLDVNSWVVGRLIPNEGTTHFVFRVNNGEHVAVTSDTYDVLTNPDNCLLEWVPQFGGDFPPYAIPADEKKPTENIVGRGIIAGFEMVGGVHSTESSFLVAYEGKVYKRRHYDVLTSRYPLLTMALIDFTFPILDNRVLEMNSKEMLIGQMQLISGGCQDSTSAPTVVQPISHRKDVKELFKWREKQDWVGVANLTIDMDLWVGSPSVVASFTNIHEQREMVRGTPKVIFERVNQIAIDRTVTISSPSGLMGETGVPKGNYQVCSSVTILQDFGVKYEAISKVTAPGMNADQIKEILRRTGRNILGDGEDEDDEDFVIAKIFGTLRGSFVTGSSSYFSPVDGNGACSSVLKNSKHDIRYSHFKTS